MGLTPYVRAQSTTPGVYKYFSNRNRKKKHIKNKKMIIYPVVGLLLVVGLEVGAEVGDVVVCVFVDQCYRRKHFDKGYIRHDNMYVQPCYGHGNHSSC